MKTRDQIVGFKSKPGARMVSLDFNADGDPDVEVHGIEVAAPSDITEEERFACEQYCVDLQEFYLGLGLERRIRRPATRGILPKNHKGIIHVEPFFTDDEECMEAILKNGRSYAAILYSNFGTVGDTTFILPHEQDDPGATGMYGMVEREFARYVVMPYLMEYANVTVAIT